MATSAAAEAALSEVTLNSSLGFTNTIAGGTMSKTNLQLAANYGSVNSPDPDEETRLKNKTGPVDQREIVSYRNRSIKTVNTYNKIYYPARVQAGEEFGIRLDEILRTQDSNGFIICDEPIVLAISWKAQLSNNMTNAVLNEIFSRALGAIPVDEDGNPDWLTLMMGSTNPLIGGSTTK